MFGEKANGKHKTTMMEKKLFSIEDSFLLSQADPLAAVNED